MKNVSEVKASIRLLISSPMAFSTVGWYSLEDDRGTFCANLPNSDYDTIKAVEEAFRDRQLYKSFAENLRAYHERFWLHRKYVLKAISRLLSGVDKAEELERLIGALLMYRIEESKKAIEKLREGVGADQADLRMYELIEGIDERARISIYDYDGMLLYDDILENMPVCYGRRPAKVRAVGEGWYQYEWC